MVDSTKPLKELRLNGLLALPPADPSLGSKAHVLGHFAMVPDLKRSLEQVGSAYEKLKVRVAKQVAKYDEQMKKKAENPHHHVHVT